MPLLAWSHGPSLCLGMGGSTLVSYEWPINFKENFNIYSYTLLYEIALNMINFDD